MSTPFTEIDFVVENIVITDGMTVVKGNWPSPVPETRHALTDIARDALYKASESIKEGMWCAGSWFEQKDEDGMIHSFEVGQLLGGDSESTLAPLSLKDAIKSHRCAEGEIALQVAVLGGDLDDYYNAVWVVNENLPKHCPSCGSGPSLNHHNDAHILNSEDPAGSLSELFRDTADTAP